MVDDISDGLEQARLKGGTEPNGMAMFFTQLKKQYGAHYGAVMGQLVEAGKINGTMEVVGGLSRFDQAAVRGKLISAALNQDVNEKLLKLQGVKLPNINTAVAGQMADFNRSLTASKGAQSGEKALTYTKAVNTLAYQYTLSGSSAAAKEAYNDIIGTTFMMVGRVRVPRFIEDTPYGVSEREANGKLEGRRKSIDLTGVITPLSITGATPDERKDRFITRIKDRGYWVNSPKGDGVMLMDPLHNPVVRANKTGEEDKQFFILTWDEIKSSPTLDFRGDTDAGPFPF
jgi:hypothetical protein